METKKQNLLVIDVRDLCYKMWGQYQYAAFTDLKTLDNFNPVLGTGKTPNGALFFTKIEDYAMQDEDHNWACPELFNYLTRNGFHHDREINSIA